MPWPPEQKQQSRERILKSAVGLFSAHGYDNVSIGDVMKDARMTHGGFYSHFRSKQELYAEAVIAGARESVMVRLPEDTLSGEELLLRLLGAYLDVAHVRQEQPPCPLAFLATDVANREEEVRTAYTKVFKRLSALVSKELPARSSSRRSRGLALSALMIGGVAVSRALNDERTVYALLKACNDLGEEWIRQERRGP